MNTDFSHFEARFQAMMDFIDTGIAKTKAGQPVDLSRLDDDIIALCMDVKKAGPDIAREAQPLIADMIARLDDLAAALRDVQDRQGGEG